MDNTVPVERSSVTLTPMDPTHMARLCEEIGKSFRQRKETDVFQFLYRYFQTLLQQDRPQEVEMYLDGIDQHTLEEYAEKVFVFTGFIRGFLCKAQGQLEESAYWFRQALVKHKTLEGIGIHNVEVLSFKELGSLDFYQKQYKEAIRKFQEAINALQLNQDSEYLLAILMYNISLCHYHLKNYRQTVEYLDKVIPLAKDTSNSYLLLDALIIKSVLLTDRYKQYHESNEYLDQAYEIAVRNRHTPSINQIWNNWGHNFFYLKQHMLAEQALQYSIRLSSKHDDTKNSLGAELKLAELWMELNRKTEAKKLLESVRKRAASKPAFKAELLDCLELLGQVEDSPTLCQKYLQEALQIASEQRNYQMSKKIKKILSENSIKKKDF